MYILGCVCVFVKVGGGKGGGIEVGGVGHRQGLLLLLLLLLLPPWALWGCGDRSLVD